MRGLLVPANLKGGANLKPPILFSFSPLLAEGMSPQLLMFDFDRAHLSTKAMRERETELYCKYMLMFQGYKVDLYGFLVHNIYVSVQRD